MSPPCLVLEDNLPAPSLDSPVLAVDVDNFATIGTNAAHIMEFGNAVLNGVHAPSLNSHEFPLTPGILSCLACPFLKQSPRAQGGAPVEPLAGAVRTAQDRPHQQS